MDQKVTPVHTSLLIRKRAAESWQEGSSISEERNNSFTQNSIASIYLILKLCDTGDGNDGNIIPPLVSSLASPKDNMEIRN